MMTETQTTQIAPAKEGDKVISSVAMTVTLVSFGMLFLTLMMGFALYRFTAPIWPPAGMEKPSLVWPIISTVLIALSSFIFNIFEQSVLKGSKEKLHLTLTLLLGLAFMASQFIFWNELKTHGIYVSSGIFPSILYAFTWIHAAHILAGLLLLVWLYKVVSDGSSMTSVKVSNVGKFWHFLGVVWLIMFVTIFVL